MGGIIAQFELGIVRVLTPLRRFELAAMDGAIQFQPPSRHFSCFGWGAGLSDVFARSIRGYCSNDNPAG